MYVCMYVYVYIYIYTHNINTYIYIYIYVYLSLSLYIYIYIYIHIVRCATTRRLTRPVPRATRSRHSDLRAFAVQISGSGMTRSAARRCQPNEHTYGNQQHNTNNKQQH